jgi:hypothetical protein
MYKISTTLIFKKLRVAATELLLAEVHIRTANLADTFSQFVCANL